MEVRPKTRSRRRRFPVKAGAIAAAGLLVILAGTAGVYIYKGQKYKDAFFQNTTINGINASGKTIEEVKALIASEIDGYTLTIHKRGGETEQITKEDINLHSEFDGSLEEILSAQEPLKWWSHQKTPVEYPVGTIVSYDRERLKEKIDSLQCFSAEQIVEPVNARLSEYISGQGYSIVPEEPGNRLVKEIVEAGIADALRNLKEDLFLEELDAYAKPEITSTDEELVKAAASLNKHVGVTVTYKFGDKTETLSGETTHNWLSVNADKTIGLDRDQVAAYVKSLGSKYNTAYKKKTLKTSYGNTVTIGSGFYGWRINQGAETDELYNIIRSGESQTREPVYSQKANSHGEHDYGNTYVEINLTAQHLFFYKDGKLLVEADFVSGNLSKGYDTPAGAYPLTYKERNATLKGENYRTPVSYWMPFNGNIGMHDANWRSSFGGNIYKTGGSHGCVNLPPSAAKAIYENISQGMPVLCYNLEGTESKATSAKPKDKPEATTAASTTPAAVKPEESTAPATPPETLPAETSAVTETTPVQETTAAAETRNRPDGPGDTGGGSEKANGEIGPGI